MDKERKTRNKSFKRIHISKQILSKSNIIGILQKMWSFIIAPFTIYNESPYVDKDVSELLQDSEKKRRFLDLAYNNKKVDFFYDSNNKLDIKELEVN